MPTTHHIPLALLASAALAAGCGGDDPAPRASAPPSVAPPAATEEASTTTNQEGGCRTARVIITITGGTGIRCARAKLIYDRYANGSGAPAGWECAVRACTKLADDGTVVDFTWNAVTE